MTSESSVAAQPAKTADLLSGTGSALAANDACVIIFCLYLPDARAGAAGEHPRHRRRRVLAQRHNPLMAQPEAQRLLACPGGPAAPKMAATAADACTQRPSPSETVAYVCAGSSGVLRRQACDVIWIFNPILVHLLDGSCISALLL
eukprot:364996-Chlamydomonas_euryale.AAC.3